MTTPPGSNQVPLPRFESFDILLEMTSDWHVGTGAGRPGSVDRLVTRDADGLPYVPAKTLTGIWRDAAERLAFGLDGGKLGPWSAWVDHLFGSQPTRDGADPALRPVAAAFSIRSARFLNAIRTGLGKNSDPGLRNALTFIKPGVKIDEQSGRAQDAHLRFEERVRAGSILEARCLLTVFGDEAQFQAARSFLVAAAELVDRLGGKRRRGAGRCTLSFKDFPLKPAIDWIDETIKNPAQLMNPPISRSLLTEGGVPVDSGSDTDKGWQCVPLILKLLEPLAVTDVTVGNVVKTLDFLPGTSLLPHVTKTFRKLGVDLGPAIVSGELRVLPATVEIGRVRGLPVPKVIFKDKSTRGFKDKVSVFNRLAEKEPGRQLKAIEGGYIGAYSRETLPVHVNRDELIDVRTHNTVEDKYQRPTSNVGGVYSYEAIRVGTESGPTRLRSELWLTRSIADALAKAQPDWWLALNGDHKFGRSAKDDYGLVRLCAEPPIDVKPRESSVLDIGQEKVLYVWLLSDVLLRNEYLRLDPSLDALRRELETRLGLKPGELRLRETPDELSHAAVRVRRIESWHVEWGLPRPTLLALAAGSCAVFTSDSVIAPATLDEIESTGIGERRGEGYGHVRFNDLLLVSAINGWSPAEKSTAKESVNPSSSSLIAKSDDSYEMARIVETEAWREAIRLGALRFAANGESRRTTLGWIVDSNGGRPGMTQLGSLRQVLQSLSRPQGGVERVKGWIEHIKLTSNRRDRWPDGALPHIRVLLDREKATVWPLLWGQRKPPATLTSDGKQWLEVELWPLAVRSLFDASIRAHKRELEPLNNSSKETYVTS